MLEIIFAAATIGKGDFVVEVQNARRDKVKTEAVFKLTNNTDRSYQRVFVKCVFFDAAGSALAIGPAIVSNVHARASDFGSAVVVLNPGEVAKSVHCDVDQVTE